MLKMALDFGLQKWKKGIVDGSGLCTTELNMPVGIDFCAELNSSVVGEFRLSTAELKTSVGTEVCAGTVSVVTIGTGVEVWLAKLMNISSW